MALMSLTLAVAPGCGDDNDNGAQQGGTETPPPTEPANWDSVKIEVRGETTTPGTCVPRELEINADGTWKAEACPSNDGEDLTGTLETAQLDQLNTLITAVLPASEATGGDTDDDGTGDGTDGGTEQPVCENRSGTTRFEVEVTVDNDTIEVVDAQTRQDCYRGGVTEAKALRDFLNTIRTSLGTPGTGGDGTGDGTCPNGDANGDGVCDGEGAGPGPGDGTGDGAGPGPGPGTPSP